jgi:hypothetical protein
MNKRRPLVCDADIAGAASSISGTPHFAKLGKSNAVIQDHAGKHNLRKCTETIQDLVCFLSIFQHGGHCHIVSHHLAGHCELADESLLNRPGLEGKNDGAGHQKGGTGNQHDDSHDLLANGAVSKGSHTISSHKYQKYVKYRPSPHLVKNLLMFIFADNR